MPAAQRMHMARDQLLAGAGLADDERACITGGDALDALQQRFRTRIFEHERSGTDRGCEGTRIGEGDEFHVSGTDRLQSR